MNQFAEHIQQLKKEHPHISDEKISEGIKQFEEQLKVVDEMMSEIRRSVSNALKIGQNLKFPPEPYAALLSEKLMNHSLHFQKTTLTGILESLIEVKKDLYYLKRK